VKLHGVQRYPELPHRRFVTQPIANRGEHFELARCESGASSSPIARNPRSIKAHAADIEAPPGLDDPAKILIGVAHFAAHCAVCHGAPGVPQGEMARGLNPLPPDLGKTVPLLSSAEIFWVLKHGIRMTGMPAWSHHSDEELWATVAFLQKLPGMNEEDYGKLVMGTMQPGGGHQHGGGTEDHPADNHDASDHPTTRRPGSWP
jgi:mono/diheme cytochrome c family protein